MIKFFFELVFFLLACVGLYTLLHQFSIYKEIYEKFKSYIFRASKKDGDNS